MLPTRSSWLEFASRVRLGQQTTTRPANGLRSQADKRKGDVIRKPPVIVLDLPRSSFLEAMLSRYLIPDTSAPKQRGTFQYQSSFWPRWKSAPIHHKSRLTAQPLTAETPTEITTTTKLTQQQLNIMTNTESVAFRGHGAKRTYGFPPSFSPDYARKDAAES